MTVRPNDEHLRSLFADPITWEIMCDPVVCNDGRTYDRRTVESRRILVSPFTRQPLKILVENVALRGEIFEAFPHLQCEYRRMCKNPHNNVLEPPSPKIRSFSTGLGTSLRTQASAPIPDYWLSSEEFDAILPFRENPELGPDEVRAYRIPQELDRLNALVAAHPTSAWPLIWRGDFFRALQNYESAELDYRGAYAVHPCGNAILGLARCALDKGNPQAALDELKKTLGQTPAAERYIVTGHCHFALGDYETAKQYYGYAVGMRHNNLENASARAGLAACYRRLNQVEAALPHEKLRDLLLNSIRIPTYPEPVPI